MATAKHAPAPARRPAPAPANPFAKGAAKGKQGGNFTFKLPDTLGQGRGRIPKGKYVGRCTDIIFEYSKKSNNPMWTWTFVITKGPHAGREFKLWTVLTDDAAWKVVETMAALGQNFQEGDEINIDRKDVIGVGATLHIKDDNGQDGDGEFSKLDKISAHPNGAGFRAGGGIAARQAQEEEEIGEEVDNIEELYNGEEKEEPLEEEEQFSCPMCEFVGNAEEVDAHMGEHEVEEEEPEPAPPPRRPAAKKAAPPAAKKAAPARGKAPATIGRGKR